mgnify:CR=1 FL=1
MMGKKETALEYFHSGYNCAQSVLLPYAGENEPYARLSSGFGGGIARMQKTCGAVTGAAMVLGLKYGAAGCPDEDSKRNLYEQIKKFDAEFVKLNGSDQCFELLGADMNTEDGRQKISILDLHRKVCDKCIETAIFLLEKNDI